MYQRHDSVMYMGGSTPSFPAQRVASEPAAHSTERIERRTRSHVRGWRLGPGPPTEARWAICSEDFRGVCRGEEYAGEYAARRVLSRWKNPPSARMHAQDMHLALRGVSRVSYPANDLRVLVSRVSRDCGVACATSLLASQ